MVSRAREIKVSGRMVLIAFVMFFAVVAAVNALMATLAIRTFGGVEADNAYKAGLEFAHDLNAARAQQARNLKVDVTTQRIAGARTEFKLSVSGIDAAQSVQLQATIELRHPADRRHDHILRLVRGKDGVFAGTADVEPGQWNVRVSLSRGEDRIFRSINKVTIP